MSAWAGVAVAGTLGGYALVSARLSRTIVSGPMVFVAVGLVLGPLGLGLLTLSKDAKPVRESVQGHARFGAVHRCAVGSVEGTTP